MSVANEISDDHIFEQVLQKAPSKRKKEEISANKLAAVESAKVDDEMVIAKPGRQQLELTSSRAKNSPADNLQKSRIDLDGMSISEFQNQDDAMEMSPDSSGSTTSLPSMPSSCIVTIIAQMNLLRR